MSPSKVSVILSDAIVERLISEGGDAVRLDVTNKIIDRTALRIIKKALNDGTLIGAVQDQAAKALTELTQEVGMELKKNSSSYWGHQQLVLSKAVREQVLPHVINEIRLEIRAEAEKVIIEYDRLNNLAEDAIRRAMAKVLTWDSIKQVVGPQVERLVAESLKKRLGA